MSHLDGNTHDSNTLAEEVRAVHTVRNKNLYMITSCDALPRSGRLPPVLHHKATLQNARMALVPDTVLHTKMMRSLLSIEEVPFN